MKWEILGDWISSNVRYWMVIIWRKAGFQLAFCFHLCLQDPSAGASVLRLCLLISTNIYFQYKRGRLRYLTEAKQTQEALLAMSQLEHEVGDFWGLNQRWFKGKCGWNEKIFYVIIEYPKKINVHLSLYLSFPLLAQVFFACTFLFYTNIYFRHKRGRFAILFYTNIYFRHKRGRFAIVLFAIV